MNQVKLEIYTPEDCLQALIVRLSNIGAGCIGKYTHVSSYTKVSGTWMPEDGSKPYHGNVNELCHGEE